MNIRQIITEELEAFIEKENTAAPYENLWQMPLAGFADAKGTYVQNLRSVVHPEHQLPQEVLEDAKTIIAVFVPFGEWVAGTNKETGLASSEWAESYELTNAMLGRLNEHLIKVLHKLGYEGRIPSEAGVFYRDEVISRWSFRHIAYAAGLGTFGLNNMLITEKGCAGRITTLVTNLDIPADAPQKEEACLWKKSGKCGACISRCPAQALTDKSFDRYKCFEQCLKNAEIYTSFGNSYASAPGQEAEDSGSEVCGKCLAALPCTYCLPK